MYQHIIKGERKRKARAVKAAKLIGGLENFPCLKHVAKFLKQFTP